VFKRIKRNNQEKINTRIMKNFRVIKPENEDYREELYNEIIQEFDYLTGYCLSGDEVQTIVSDIIEFVIYKQNTISNG